MIDSRVRKHLELLIALGMLLATGLASAQSYRSHVQPFIKAQCAECHGADAPTLAEFKLDEEKYKKEKLGPRTDTYENLSLVPQRWEEGLLNRVLADFRPIL